MLNGTEPEMRLACAVIAQAIKDAMTYDKKWMTPSQRNSNNLVRDEARDYLVRRMWEPDDIFGSLARTCLPASAREVLFRQIGIIRCRSTKGGD